MLILLGEIIEDVISEIKKQISVFSVLYKAEVA